MEIIEESEVAELLALCKRIHRMTSALMEGLDFADKRVKDIERTLRVVEFRQRYKEEPEDED